MGKGRLQIWLKEKGKSALGNTLNTIGEKTSIPILSNIIEGIGESLMDDPELSPEEKAEAAEIIKAELDYLKIEQQEVTKRWESDNASDSTLSRTARPLTLHFISVLLLSYFVVGYCGVYLPPEYTSLLIVIVPTVYGGYFALREFGKHSKNKFKK
jgi:hypothetical protein